MTDQIQRELGVDKKILFGDHHESHAAAAFYPFPFEGAVAELGFTPVDDHVSTRDPCWLSY